MRDREIIWKEPSADSNDSILEVLLDIRDLLVQANNELINIELETIGLKSD